MYKNQTATECHSKAPLKSERIKIDVFGET